MIHLRQSNGESATAAVRRCLGCGMRLEPAELVMCFDCARERAGGAAALPRDGSEQPTAAGGAHVG